MSVRGDAPYGFKPYQRLLQANWYKVASTNYNIFKNDFVRRAAAGGVVGAIAGVNKKLLGVALAFKDETDVPESYYASGSTSHKCLVADHPDQMYHAQEDCAATCIRMIDRGVNINFVRGHAGRTQTGMGRMELDSSARGASNSRQLILLDELDETDNVGTQVTKSYKRWTVRINLHDFYPKKGTSGI
jgi:hypothetical protein